MSAIAVPRSVWAEAEETLRRCGIMGRECVVYLCGVRDCECACRVTAVYHPSHEGTAIGYSVSIPELLKLNSWLFQLTISVLVQIHTHPGAAFHSNTDDRWPTIETVGFLSLVVPDFARLGLLGLQGCYLTEYLGAGDWREVPRASMTERIRLEE